MLCITSIHNRNNSLYDQAIGFLNIFLDINRLDPYALSHKELSSAQFTSKGYGDHFCLAEVHISKLVTAKNS